MSSRLGISVARAWYGESMSTKLSTPSRSVLARGEEQEAQGQAATPYRDGTPKPEPIFGLAARPAPDWGWRSVKRRGNRAYRAGEETPQ